MSVGASTENERRPGSPPLVWVFFYGSYINLDVLKEVDLTPRDVEVATLSGFGLSIAPRANIVRDPQAVVYGILARATHVELDRLYTEHALGKLGGVWLPEAVLVTDEQGRLRPALTYIAPDMAPSAAETDYVERIARPAEAFGFPDAYVRKIRSFHPVNE